MTATVSVKIDGYAEKFALFSDDGAYRYLLTRAWAPGGPRALVVGHNPSTANGTKDDQTIRRLNQLVAQAGFNGYTIVNLFAAVCTDPKGLREMRGPNGRWNDQHIREELGKASTLIVAWGGASPLGTDADLQREWVLKCASRRLMPVKCFGFTKDGAPRHPSRLPRTTLLCDFPRAT